MTRSAPLPRRHVGELVTPFELESLAHGTLRVPCEPTVHLQFRRFAGCPVCNLHLRSFAKRHAELVAASVRTVAFFHSTAEQMRPYQGDLPFATVADPDRTWYGRFGVERSAFAVVHPKVLGSAMRGLFQAKSNPFVGGGDQTGLPADFLIAPSGELVAVHYGAHADDQWTVDEVLALARRALDQDWEHGPRG